MLPAALSPMSSQTLDPGYTTVLPETGQLVRVRDRHWVVTNVLRSSLLRETLAPDRPPSHLVELTSVEPHSGQR